MSLLRPSAEQWTQVYAELLRPNLLRGWKFAESCGLGVLANTVWRVGGVNFFQSIVDFVKSLLDWWFIVDPWEQAIRVRFGKNVRLFTAGVYFKFPFFDSIYKQNTRRRVCDVPLITLTTSDKVTISVHSSLGYVVVDVLKLHNTLQDAELAVKQEALGHVTRFVVSRSIADCSPEAITQYVTESLNLEKYGLGEVEFFLSGFVAGVRTYRMINDGMYAYAGAPSGLSTAAPAGVKS